MYVHIGNNIYVLKKDIVGIFNVKSLNLNEKNNYFKDLTKLGNIKNTINDNVKSYIITCKSKKKGTSKNTCNIYCSNISSNTIVNRFRDVEIDWRYKDGKR
ncbi:MAG: DUF370 domain-containing protein [Tissierellia bacterium]|nr:DUF370 domain-containing protein [Tissierellia bacterium]